MSFTCEMTAAAVAPVNIVSLADTRVAVPFRRIKSSLSLHIKFRTVDGYGLILFNNGSQNDFLAVELEAGFIKLVYQINQMKEEITSRKDTQLNDTEWHSVSVTLRLDGRLNLQVDGFSRTGKWV